MNQNILIAPVSTINRDFLIQKTTDELRQNSKDLNNYNHFSKITKLREVRAELKRKLIFYKSFFNNK